jgi:MoaA/NifB/PqqE/SkfB family radical SAM enzyme
VKRVYVEIGNVCNLQCDFCPPVERAKQAMDLPFFEKVMAEVAPVADEVALHLMGEPLRHPLLGPFVAVCARHAVPVNITTNAVLLTGERREILLDPIVRQVNLSVHSFEANFGQADVGPYLDRVFAWVREALARRPDLYVNLRLWDLAEPTALSAKNQLIRRRISEDFGFSFENLAVDVRRKKGFRVQGRLYVSFDSRFTWPSLQAPERGTQGFCHGLSTHVGVLADGTVVPCCLDKEAAIPLGNLRTQSLAAVLAGPRASRMREGFKRHELVEDLCRRCQYISRFDRKRTPDAAHA